MSPVLNEEQMIAKIEADLAQRRAKIKEKEDQRKERIVKRIEAKEANIRKLDAEILALTEELGLDAVPLLDGRVPLVRLEEVKARIKDVEGTDAPAPE